MERPVLFSNEMVKAILDGIKTQTRRILTTQPLDILDTKNICKGKSWVAVLKGPLNSRGVFFKCKHGIVGDVLWVKETHYQFGRWIKAGLTKTKRDKWSFVCRKENEAKYIGDEIGIEIKKGKSDKIGWYKRPSLFMPRWASRITLKITDVNFERLQNISDSDCHAEGCPNDGSCPEPRVWYQHLWDAINGKKYPWSTNPWVWKICFKRI